MDWILKENKHQKVGKSAGGDSDYNQTAKAEQSLSYSRDCLSTMLDEYRK